VVARGVAPVPQAPAWAVRAWEAWDKWVRRRTVPR
jgi:hypothetical protein